MILQTNRRLANNSENLPINRGLANNSGNQFLADFDVDSSLNNVISEISEEDYRTFVESSLNDYTVENKDGRIYNLMSEVVLNNNLAPITSFYIYNDTLQLTLILNPIDNKWHLDYANVQLSKTLSKTFLTKDIYSKETSFLMVAIL